MKASKQRSVERQDAAGMLAQVAESWPVAGGVVQWLVASD